MKVLKPKLKERKRCLPRYRRGKEIVKTAMMKKTRYEVGRFVYEKGNEKEFFVILL